ncbi:RHS repeat-associated protein [Hamadaea flava]|uniref:LamG-like jellyroll fold domain-containing protein n=1 Tax=Hamadaea flava TaxID=1742688 RepID=A0ABV8LNP5_9ACTN|nr:LamG-like jellyroll fold domain-containing protein [Hamadaea flava]MCP2323337.1 RHS repeat-associated protein [Hamadaea flava]
MRSWPRRVVFVALVLFGLSVGVPSGVVPENGSFPLGWLTSWMAQRPLWAYGSPTAGLPAVAQGHAGKGGYVSAEETDSHTGTGRAPKKVANGLDGYQPSKVDSSPTKQTVVSPKGFDEKSKVRVPQASSATSTMWRDSNGIYARQVFQEPVNYKAADGTWQPIDGTFKRTASGRWETAANSWKLSIAGGTSTATSTAEDASGTVPLALAGSAAQDLVTVTAPTGEIVGYSLEGATLGEPAVSDGSALYTGVLPSTDVRIESQAMAAKETLILHSSSAPSTWTYPLNLSGVTPSINADGEVVFTNQAGTIVARMPRGYLKDSSFNAQSGEAAFSHDVTYELVDVDGQPAVRVTASAAWLADPARVFPVYVDPVLRLDTDGDTYVMYGDDVDHSGEDTLKIGTANGGTTRAKSLLHFGDFATTYGGKHLTYVTLNLFMTWQYNCTAQPFSVYAVGASWAATSARWGSSTTYGGPALRSPALGTASPNSAAACGNTGSSATVGDWVPVILSVDEFNAWTTGGSTNYGLAVSANSDTTNAQWKRFTSRNGPTGDTACGGRTCAPYIYAIYTDDVLPQVDTRYPANGATVDTLTPELTTRAHDPDNWPAKGLKYQYVVYNDVWTRLWTSTWSTTPSVTVPAGILAWNKSYNYTVLLDDYSLKSAERPYAFTTPVPQPAIASQFSQNSGKGFDPSTGNYTTSATDASIAGVGPGLEITRYYNSINRNSDTAAFGAGWTSVVDMRATQVKDFAGTLQTVSVRYPTGQEVAFGRNSDGSFTAPMGRYAVFKPILSGTTVVGYSLTDKDATTYTFAQASGTTVWKISSITDANGRTLTFTYNASGQLETMTSASGRSLHVEWMTSSSTRDYISRIYTDPAISGDASTVKSWTYTVDNVKLTSVCGPVASECTTYAYTSISQGANTVLNSGAYSYWRLGDAPGPIAKSSVLARAGTDNGLYNNVTVGPDKMYTQASASAAFNGTSSSVQLPGKLVTDGTYQSISLWFKTTTAGGVLFSYSAGAISGGTTAGNYTPALYIDANGYLRGEFWQGTTTPIKSLTTVTDDTWHHVALIGAGDTQTMYLDNTVQGTLAGTISMYQTGGASYEYLGAGFIGHGWPDHANSGASPAKATYFTGQISDAAFFTKALARSEVAAVRDAARWSSYELTKITRPSGRVTAQVTYDTASAKVTTVTDENGGTWTLNAPTIAGDSDVYAASVLGSKPANYWRLDEPGDTTDAVNEVAGGTATYAGTVTFSETGPFADRTAVKLDGSSANLLLPTSNINLGGPASVSLWFKMPSASTAGGVLYGYQNGPITDPTATTSAVPALYVGTDGKLRGGFWTTAGGTPITTTTSVADGKWHQATLAASSASQTLYLDGVAIGTKNVALSVPANGYSYLGAGKWASWIGSNAANPVGYFPGWIAEAAFFGSTLSADEIAAQFAASKASLPQVLTTVDTTITTISMPVQTVTVTDPGGQTISYAYDLANGSRMVSQTDAIGKTTRYGYDTGGFSSLEYDENGIWTQSIQDSRGNTIQQISCQDQDQNKCSSVYFEYYLNAADSVDPRNDQIVSSRDARSTSATDNTYKTTNAYDAKGNATTVTDPLGRVTTTAYTDGTTTAAYGGGFAPAGLPASVTKPSGAIETIEYYPNGDVGRVTTPAGKVTTYTYDNLGRKLSEAEVTSTFATGLTTTYTYDDAGRVLTQTDPPVTNRVTGAVHTSVTTNVYDVDGNMTSQTISDSTGGDIARTETVAFNKYGQKESQTDAVGNTTQFGYDTYGNVVLETEADGGQTRYELDANGNLLNAYMVGYTGDPNNPQTAAEILIQAKKYDPAGRLAWEKDAAGWYTAYDYTNNGLVAKVIRADGDPENGTSKKFVTQLNTYDPAGNLTQQVTNNGATTTVYEYDAAGRQWRTTLDANGLNRVTTNVFAADDTVVSTRSSSGTAGTLMARSDTMYDPEGNVQAQTSYATDPATTPVAWWKLNQSTGTDAADAAGNAIAGMSSTGVTWNGTAATFDGSTGYLSVSDPVVDTSRSFTMSAWVTLADKNANHPVVLKSSRSSSSFYLMYEQSTDKWYATGSQTTYGGSWKALRSTSSPTVGTATHLAVVYDAAAQTYSMYVNGTLEATTTGVVNRQDARGSFYIGKYSSYYMAGSIRDVQVYQDALTATQIATVKGGTTPAAGASVSRAMMATDEGGLIRSSKDPNGNVTSISNDEAGRPALLTGATVTAETYSGGTTSARPVTYIGYDTFGDKTETVDGNGNRTVHVFDRAGRQYETHLPAYTPPGSSTVINPVASQTYDALSQVTTSTDALGKTTHYDYDQLGRVWKTTAPDGGISYASYDLLGNQTWSKDPTSKISGATYDYLGRQTTSYQHMNAANVDYTTTYSYDTYGRLQTVTTPGGSTTGYTYDPAGETLTTIINSSRITKVDYDGLGRPVKTTNPDLTYSQVSYDMLGRAKLTSSYKPGTTPTLLASTSATYDKAGNQLTSTDAENNTITYTYDPTGMILSETQPITATDAIATTFGYDLAGNRTRFTDGRGNKFWTTYNTLGLPESQIEPATTAYSAAADRTYTTAYNAAGQAASQTQPGGVTQSYAYDDAGRMTSQSGTGADGATGTRTFGYDLAGRITSFDTGVGTNTIGYEDRGLPSTISGPSGNSAFEYDLNGSMTKRTDAAGTTTYSYFTSGRDSGLLSQVANTSAGVDIRFDPYNDMGSATTLTYYSGNAKADTRTFAYDDLHRMTSDEVKTTGGATVSKIVYGWDKNGNEKTKTTTNFAGVTRSNTYTYDKADRLVTWNDGTTSTTYAYDKSGNRTQNGTRLFVYDERNRLVGDGATTYNYTARGTLSSTQTGSTTYTTTADAFGQILSQGSAGGTQTYTYDALGRAIKTGFAYTGLDNDLAADSETTYVRDPSSDLVGEVRTADQTKRLTLTDLHDDVVGQLTATSATLDGSVNYDPLGKVLASSGTVIGHLGYQSEWTESVTGRVNMLARWYNTDTGQFDTRDTASNSPTPDSINANRYQYGNANPMTATDPSGHWPSWIKKATSAVSNTFSSAYNSVKSYASSAANYASSRMSAARSWAADRYDAASNYVNKKVSQAKNYVKKKVEQGRKYVQKKAQQLKHKVKNTYNKVKQAAKQVKAKAARHVAKVVKNVKDAAKATGKWIKDHKDAIIEVVAVVATVAATIALGPVGGLLVGIAINVAKDAATGKIHSLADLGRSVLSGAITGTIGAVTGGVGGAIGGKIAGMVAGKVGTGILARAATGAIGGAISGGVGGGLGDAATQYAQTGHVDWGRAGAAALTGAAVGGAMGGIGGALTKPRTEGSQGSPGKTCHSFDPSTRVLMANGSTKAIKDVKIGDKVTATDPTTGRTEAKPVTVLHNNNDSDLADITVRDQKTGKSTVLHTTWFHPFWNATNSQWTDAKDLKTGDRLRDANGQTTQIVAAVKVWTGLRWMRDLTVDDIHAYYVLAGNVPVLVHNVDQKRLCDLTLGPDGSRKAEGVTAERGDTVLPHEQKMVNESGDRNGCATCPATSSGYADGHWTGDHTPPNKAAPNGPWTLYPQCKTCAKQQGGIVNGINREWYDFPAEPRFPGLVDGTRLGLINL